MIREVRSLAREHTESAIAVLVGIAGDKKAPHSARVSACTALLDRAWGRPETSIALSRPPTELPAGYSPCTPDEAALLYHDLVNGIIGTESALEAIERAPASIRAHKPDTPPTSEPKSLVPVVFPFVPPNPPPRVDDKPSESSPAGVAPESPASELPKPARPSDAFDDAGCPTGTALEAAQRRREEAAVEARRANERRVEEQNARERAAAAERDRRIAEEEA